MQAAQSQVAAAAAEEPSGAAEPAQAVASPASPALVHYTMGPDEHILQELDLTKAKACLARVCNIVCALVTSFFTSKHVLEILGLVSSDLAALLEQAGLILNDRNTCTCNTDPII